jgi:pyrimidine-nucleoside phosphorylase
VEQFKRQLGRVGLVIGGQSADLAPADGKLYALRDVTSTVSSLPLIVGSVMSKKIAGGADAILLDVKVGSGAFMKTVDEARELAETMVRIGSQLERRMVALISDMNEPLGRAVGNALEVREAIDTLHGGGPHGFRHHCLRVVAELLVLVGRAEDLEAGKAQAADTITSGAAWEKFLAFVEAQGGDTSYVKQPDRLPQAEIARPMEAAESGYLQKVNAAQVGMAVVDLGGGREKKGQPIDHAVGLVLHKKIGDRIEQGEPIYTLYANDEQRLQEARERLRAAYVISPQEVEPLPLFYGRVTAE